MAPPTPNKLNYDDQGMTSLQHTLPSPAATWLSAQRNSLTNLDGVQGFRNLVVLNLSHNSLTDITHVAELRRLNALILTHNRITSLEPVAPLVALNTLVVSHNPLQVTTAIARLSSLTKLSATDCQLRALPWHGAKEVQLGKLVELRLNNNQLQDLDGLAHCPGLQRLSVKDNEVLDLQGLKQLQGLTHLTVEGNPGYAKWLNPVDRVMKMISGLRYLNDHPTVTNEKARKKGERRRQRAAWEEMKERKQRAG
eukprot:EG_transcript_24717